MADIQIIKITALNRVPVLIECLLLYYTVLILIIVKIVFRLTTIQGTRASTVLDLGLRYAFCKF